VSFMLRALTSSCNPAMWGQTHWKLYDFGAFSQLFLSDVSE
jgi:hypothetical protein